MDKTKTNPGIIVIIGVLSLYLISGLSSAITPAVNSLAVAYPEYPINVITMVSTISQLAMVVTTLGCSVTLKKMGFKGTTYLGLGLCLVGGVIPFFVNLSFPLLLVARVAVGLGMGFFTPLLSTYITATFDMDRRGQLMGYGSTIIGLSGIIYSLVGGWLVGLSLKYVWLVHFLVLVPLVGTLVIPDMPRDGAEMPQEGESADATQSEEQKSKVFLGLPGRVWILICISGLVSMFVNPTLVYCSPIVEGEGIGTAMDAASITAAFSFACLVAGLLLGTLYSKLGNKIFAICSVALVVAMAFTAFGKSLTMLYIGAALTAFAFATFSTCAMVSLSGIVSSAQYTMAVGVMTAGSSLLSFVATTFYAAIGSLFGQASSVRFPFYVNMLLFAIVAVIMLFGSKKLFSPE